MFFSERFAPVWHWSKEQAQKENTPIAWLLHRNNLFLRISMAYFCCFTDNFKYLSITLDWMLNRTILLLSTPCTFNSVGLSEEVLQSNVYCTKPMHHNIIKIIFPSLCLPCSSPVRKFNPDKFYQPWKKPSAFTLPSCLK